MVTFIATAFHEAHFPLVESLLCQTDPDWTLIVYHNGHNAHLQAILEALGDNRILYKESSDNTGFWGCYNRITGLSQVSSPYIVQTSIQDYYLPHTLAEIKKHQGRDLIYWNSIHHTIGYDRILDCIPQPGSIDWGNFAVKADLAREVGINYPEEYMADGHFVSELMTRNPTQHKIEMVLTIHN